MSEQPADSTHGADDLLPHDLVPSEDNPLAEGLPDGETAGDLLHDGKPADQWADDEDDDADDDADGNDGDGDTAT